MGNIPSLVADIGGTNTRVALVENGKIREIRLSDLAK